MNSENQWTNIPLSDVTVARFSQIAEKAGVRQPDGVVERVWGKVGEDGKNQTREELLKKNFETLYKKNANMGRGAEVRDPEPQLELAAEPDTETALSGVKTLQERLLGLMNNVRNFFTGSR